MTAPEAAEAAARATVRDRLAAHGLPADEVEVAVLAREYQTMRPRIDELYAVARALDAAPATVFRPAD